MKNIILVILAILFMVIILFHFMNVQLEYFESKPLNCKQSDQNDAISKLFYNIHLSSDELNNIQNIIHSQGTYSDDSIIQSLINLNISDSALNGILTDSITYPSSKDKLNKFNCELKQVIKSEFDEGLIIYFPLDKISTDGSTIVNEAISQKLVPPDQAYTGTLVAAGTGVKPSLDSNDVRGIGMNSMKFNGTNKTDGGYIKINKLPTFWDKSNQNFMGFSLAVWVKSSNYPSNSDWSKIFDFAAGDVYNNNIFATVTNTHNKTKGDLAFIVANGSSSNVEPAAGITYVDPAGNGVLDNTWRHYVFTITPSNNTGGINYKIYINGVLTASNYYNAKMSNEGIDSYAVSGPDPSKSNPPNNVVRKFNFIGKSNFSFDNYFNGWMSDLRIYTKELSADIIGRLYNYVNPVIDTSNMFNPVELSKANGALPNMPGAPMGPAPKLNFQLIAQQNNITTDAKGILTWRDNSGLQNHAVSSDAGVKYCNITNKVTVPSGSYMDIALNSNCNYGAPFTLFMVADVKSFNPTVVKGSGNMRANHLVGSPDFDGFEIIVVDNVIYCVILGRTSVNQSMNMTGIDGNGRNIYTAQCDAQGNISLWINSTPIITNKQFPSGLTPQNKKIRLACAFGQDQYPSSDNIDFNQVIHVSGLLTIDYIAYIEASMATTWSIRSKMNKINPHL